MNAILQHVFWNRKTRRLVLDILRMHPIRKGRVMCICWSGAQYNCNPRAIANQLIKSNRFDVWFAFLNPSRFRAELPSQINAVEIGSLEYYRLLFTSQFIIANTHVSEALFPYKRDTQSYIFTGHGASGIKKIEHDAPTLSPQFLTNADKDVLRIDLFLSCSSFRSMVIRSAYRYTGEILEKGTPRNDALFSSIATRNVASSKRYLIYAPTFRSNGRRDVYQFDADRVVAALEQRFGGEWYIRVSSHPNMRSYYREIYDFSHPRLIDVGGEDLQPLLLTSDALLTDYSSAAMDFTLNDVALTTSLPSSARVEFTEQPHPVFQLSKDIDDYDRGFYLDPRTLPFPFATTENQLIDNILHFDSEKYLKDLDHFNREVIGLHETGHASEAVVEWMLQKMNRK